MSEGDEWERLGVDRPGCWFGGSKNDLVDQVFTRFNAGPDESSEFGELLARNELCSSEGVDGGARGEANTSN